MLVSMETVHHLTLYVLQRIVAKVTGEIKCFQHVGGMEFSCLQAFCLLQNLSSTVCLLPNVADVRPTSGSSPEFCLVAFASREKECGL